MQFRKYNIPPKNQGGGQSTSESQTPSYDGGGGYVQPVDLTDVWNAINDNTTSISNNTTRIGNLQTQINNIEGKYLKHGGDNDDSDYGFGSLTTDLIKSTRIYDRSCGYEIYGDVDNGYTITVEDLDNSMIPFSGAESINYMVDYVGYATGTVEYPDAFHLANTTTGAIVKFQAGYNANPSQYFTLQEEHAYVRITDSTSGDDEMPPDMRPAPPGAQYQQISDTMYYHPQDNTTHIYEEADVAELDIIDIEITATTAQAEIVNGAWMELEKDEQGNWIVPLDILGDDMTYSLRYKATVHYNRPNISGNFSVFIEGTDANNNQTVLYGGSTRRTTVTSTAVSVMNNNNGYALMSDGLYKITNGSWTKLI